MNHHHLNGSAVLTIQGTPYELQVIFGKPWKIELFEGRRIVDSFATIDDALEWVRQEEKE